MDTRRRPTWVLILRSVKFGSNRPDRKKYKREEKNHKEGALSAIRGSGANRMHCHRSTLFFFVPSKKYGHAYKINTFSSGYIFRCYNKNNKKRSNPPIWRGKQHCFTTCHISTFLYGSITPCGKCVLLTAELTFTTNSFSLLKRIFILFWMRCGCISIESEIWYKL